MHTAGQSLRSRTSRGLSGEDFEGLVTGAVVPCEETALPSRVKPDPEPEQSLSWLEEWLALLDDFGTLYLSRAEVKVPEPASIAVVVTVSLARSASGQGEENASLWRLGHHKSVSRDSAHGVQGTS